MRLRNLPNFARLITAVSYSFALSTTAAQSEPSPLSDVKALDSYRYKAEGKVRSSWVAPPVHQQDYEECTCYFRITKDGHIAKLEFKNEYDNSINYTVPPLFGKPPLDIKQRDKDPFTNSCLAALRKTAFDPPPSSIGEVNVRGEFKNHSGNLQVSLEALRTSVKLDPHGFVADPNYLPQVIFVRSGDALVRTSVDLSHINFAPYVASVNKKIEQAWTPGGGLSSLTCFLTLDSSGNVQTVKLISLLPFQLDEKLSESFLAAIKKAEPFENTPTGIGLIVLFGFIGERDGKPIISLQEGRIEPLAALVPPNDLPSTFK